MELDAYVPLTDDHRRYEFLSEGPQGSIRKIVQFQRLNHQLFNLAFGDWNEEEQRMSDKVRSNNDDRDKVLATIAAAVIDFMEYHPQAVIYATGSTSARTRLYQISLHRHWAEISRLYSVKGIIQGVALPFQPNKNYDAFILAAKEKK